MLADVPTGLVIGSGVFIREADFADYDLQVGGSGEAYYCAVCAVRHQPDSYIGRRHDPNGAFFEVQPAMYEPGCILCQTARPPSRHDRRGDGAHRRHRFPAS